MMGSLYNLHQPPYNPHQPPYNPHQPPYNPHQPSYNPHQPSYNTHDPQPYQSGEPHRSNVKTTEQKKSNNENQHKNKMGNVLEQLQQLQKQKQIL